MRVLKMCASLAVGLLIYLAAFQRPYALAVAGKIIGGDQPCPWNQLWPYPWQNEKFDRLRKSALTSIKLIQEDKKAGVEQFQTPTRAFWLKSDGRSLGGSELLAFVLAEQQWIAEALPGHGVRKGDVVVDVGAHVGTFGDDALRLGASRVIMIEPDPVNVECIRRNFKQEIADGRVVVVPEGAWSSTSTLDFSVGVANSGTGSLVVEEEGAQKIKVPVRPLDDMLRDLGVAKVDFIKMDIEGAEREALKGALATLRGSKPRLMLDMYHLADDAVVLPRIIQTSNASYRAFCALCAIRSEREREDRRIVPYASFWE